MLTNCSVECYFMKMKYPKCMTLPYLEATFDYSKTICGMDFAIFGSIYKRALLELLINPPLVII